jgi:hypothetical protein
MVCNMHSTTICDPQCSGHEFRNECVQVLTKSAPYNSILPQRTSIPHFTKSNHHKQSTYLRIPSFSPPIVGRAEQKPRAGMYDWVGWAGAWPIYSDALMLVDRSTRSGLLDSKLGSWSLSGKVRIRSYQICLLSISYRKDIIVPINRSHRQLGSQKQ